MYSQSRFGRSVFPSCHVFTTRARTCLQVCVRARVCLWSLRQDWITKRMAHLTSSGGIGLWDTQIDAYMRLYNDTFQIVSFQRLSLGGCTGLRNSSSRRSCIA